MYVYDAFDREMLRTRAAEFRDQVERRLAGALSEEEFRPLRLMNGLYLQLHAYMLRVAVPYGVLSSQQLRAFARIARKFDRGSGHFTTRQNIQFNWLRLVDVPDILDVLSEVDMHAMQTSGNCIRNVTCDPFAGVADDEIADPRPWAEVVRQWSTLHPEFSFLPRKFKIAISGAREDRAAVWFHDIGLFLVTNHRSELGFRVIVGGGQGRTPVVGKEISPFVPSDHLLSYLEAILRVYNRYGRRDNLYKSRIKILVNALGINTFREEVEALWELARGGSVDLGADEYSRISEAFSSNFSTGARTNPVEPDLRRDAEELRWCRLNASRHKDPAYTNITIALKGEGRVPGDATAEEMDALAGLADQFSGGELRITYTQNLILPSVLKEHLSDLYRNLKALKLVAGLPDHIGDPIVCPGLDYCNLANARSLPLARELAERFSSPERQELIGKLRLNISGCINACGHHHSAHIGVLGVDKKGVEAYQITLGGHGGGDHRDVAIGKIVGPAMSSSDVLDGIERVVDVFLANRKDDESFLTAFNRLGLVPFKESIYARI